ncbi:MAG: hypothetical protein ACEQSK_06925 [Sphingomonadaceae bacterium]
MKLFNEIRIAQVFVFNGSQFAKNSAHTAVRLLPVHREADGALMARGSFDVKHFDLLLPVEPA